MQETEPKVPAAENGDMLRAFFIAVVALGLIGSCAIEVLAYYDPPPSYYPQ